MALFGDMVRKDTTELGIVAYMPPTEKASKTCHFSFFETFSRHSRGIGSVRIATSVITLTIPPLKESIP